MRPSNGAPGDAARDPRRTYGRRRTIGFALSIAWLALVVAGCSDAPRSASAPEPTSLVNVFAGTKAAAQDFGTGGGAGNTYPGAVVPFGMLQWSPDTVPGKVNAPGGYARDDTVLRGFSLTHVSGAGCAIHQDVPLLPTVEPVTGSPAVADSYLIEPRYLPSFDHAHEEAEPGFYGVTLDPETERATTVELSATTRTGIGRIVFPATETASVLFNAGGSAMANGNVAFVIDPEAREVSGSVESGQFCYHRNRYVLHFVAQFDRPFASHGTWQGETLSPGSAASSDTFRGDFPCPFQLRPLGQAPKSPTHSCGAQAGAYVTFDARDRREVRVRVAVSYVGVDAARDNLRREQGDGFDVEGVRRAAHEAWVDALGRVAIRGGEDADRRTFYTMLYHALLAPTSFSDADGRYFGMDGAVHDAGGRIRYTTFSGWDVYRSQIPLLAMLFPERASDMMESLVANARESGWLPRWSVAAGQTDVMVGDPAAAMLAGAAAFGARDFDQRAALAAMIKGASQEGRSPNADYVERQGLSGYLAHGYVPHDGTAGSSGQNTSIFGDTAQVWGSAATTLEYGIADFALAAFAAALDDTATCRAAAARAGAWSLLVDPETRFVRPRFADGSYLTPFDPASGEGFAEGNAAQYTWMVPHDVAGLAAALGGADAARGRLDDFFSTLDAGPAAPYAFLGNEPGWISPYLYDWLGAPARTQDVVRRAILQLFSAEADGYVGNDDLGQMSAWYVFGALGFHPATPGSDVVVLASPLFPEAMLRLGDRTLTIAGEGASRERPFVSGVTLDGAALARPWLRWSELGTASRIGFVLSDRPSEWGSAHDAAPPSYGADGTDVCAAR
ncbi:GH92 family glycosyl hydrolase [Candidatus Binatia bacterium]|nr:GH92 family glycosyl hydrolase [Candidatus Binatia bacterium]